MAQVQRIDLLQNNFACATAKFPYHTRTRTHYSLVVRDGEPVATGQVLGVAPPVNAVVVGASAPPAPSGFCTQCGAPMASDARFCGSCGAAK